MRTTDVSALPGPVLRGAKAEDNSRGRQSKATPGQLAGDSCPDDCHYCWGPETD